MFVKVDKVVVPNECGRELRLSELGGNCTEEIARKSNQAVEDGEEG